MIIIVLYMYVKIREENIYSRYSYSCFFFSFTNIKRIIEGKKILKTEINFQ